MQRLLSDALTELLTLSLTSPYLLLMRAPGLDVWARALQGYLSKPAASCSGLGVKWHFTEKASRTRKTKQPVYFLSWANSDICLFLLRPCSFFFFLSFFFSLYFLTSALLRGYVSTRRTDAQAQRKMSIFTHRHTRTLTCTEAADGRCRRSPPQTVVDSWGTLLSHFGLLV